MALNLNDLDSLDSDYAIEFTKEKLKRQQKKWPKALKQALIMTTLGKEIIQGLSSVTNTRDQKALKHKESGKRIK